MCHFYGWSWQDCRATPVKLFFSLYRAGCKMETAQYRELLDITMMPTAEWKCYADKRDRYNKMINPEPAELPPKPPEYYVKAESKEAKAMIFSIFRSAKRGV